MKTLKHPLKPMRAIAFYTSILMAGAGLSQQAFSQNHQLGDATFAAASDKSGANKYWPMPLEIITRYAGYGEYEGFIRSESYHGLESVAAVKTVKWSIRYSSALAGVQDLTTPTGSLVASPEDWWLAVDAKGDIRVLKFVRAGVTIFEASPKNTPPVLMPGKLAAGDTWTVFGKTFTVLDLGATLGKDGNLLKLKVAEGNEFAFDYYAAGRGLVATQEGVDTTSTPSGWALMKR